LGRNPGPVPDSFFFFFLFNKIPKIISNFQNS
jgi:hypothetical protein